MSRLIVKNLPENVKEARLREIFSNHGGEITDVKLCFTKKGVFRKFAFIGYKNDVDATNASNYLNKTFIDTCKITVEKCADLGDISEARPWSKYSKGSSSFRRYTKEIEDRKKRIKELQFGNEEHLKKEKKKGNRALEALNDVENDSEFQEFLSVHLNKSTKQLWANENADAHGKVKGVKRKAGHKDFSKVLSDQEGDCNENDKRTTAVRIKKPDKAKLGIDNNRENDDNIDSGGMHKNDSSGDELSDDEGESLNTAEEKKNQMKVPKKEEVGNDKSSDMDWLKAKVSKAKVETSNSSELTAKEESEKYQELSGDSDTSSSSEEEANSLPQEEKKELGSGTSSIIPDGCITIKMRGVPFKSSEKDIINFFKPLQIEDIRFTTNKEGKRSGYVFVDFKTAEDARKGMKKDKQEMKGRYVELFAAPHKENPNLFKKDSWNVDADVSDTGRLYLRNLSYTCAEEDLEKLFSKYGNLVEVHVPIDKNSNRATGFAFVTFMMPEHAMKAWTELDGKVFQGRILHVIPGRPKKEEKMNVKGESFKKSKEAEQKALSGSAHNWNVLFLGQNAIADVMADRLNKSKRELLDGDGSNSVAVRMALGETELVSETRKFLESHGVKLDVFGQAITARSKEVIIVKNLPPGTTQNEIFEAFSKYGDLGRVLMPPFGITAIVEFVNAKDAKQAFMNLAYSKFKHTPLYLEWAPVDILSGDVTAKDEDNEEEKESSDESENESSEGTVIFVKNLNFDTAEDKLKMLFSSCGKIKNATIAKKKDPKREGKMLSMGYGFVEFKKVETADKAIKNLQGCQLDGHKLELKKSHRETMAPKSSRKRAIEKKQTSSKIVVRNIPFEANVKEIKDLFSTFGVIKSVRLPKKMVGTGSHRGFAFVDFTSKQDAKRAFKALCQSTHLYGRRLVLEWAEDDESVDALRQKTAQHYHEDDPLPKKQKQTLTNALEKATAISDDT